MKQSSVFESGRFDDLAQYLLLLRKTESSAFVATRDLEKNLARH